MRSLPVYPVTWRETVRQFGPVKAFIKNLFRVLGIRSAVVTALDVTAQRPSTALDGDIRAASLDDTSLFDAAGLRGWLEPKLQRGPTWINAGEGELRAWYCLKRPDCKIAN